MTINDKQWQWWEKVSCGRNLNGNGLPGESAPPAGDLQGAHQLHADHQGGGENRGETISPIFSWISEKIWSQVQSLLLAAVSPFLASLLSQAGTGLITSHHLLQFFCWYLFLNLFLSFSFFRKHVHLNPFLSHRPSQILLHLPALWEAFQRRRVFLGISPQCLSAID